MRLIALVAVVIAAVAAAVAFVTLRDDGEDAASPEVALEDGLPVEPTPAAESELGTKRGEPAGEAALVLPSPPPTPAATWTDLTQTAASEGSIRVIVTLKLTAQPEGLLTSGARADQRRRIRSAGSRVLSSVSGEATAVDRFEAVPVIALDATPEVLADLRASPAVASVVEDVARAIPPWGVAGAVGAAADGLNDWWDLDQAGINASIEGGYDGAGQAVAILDSGVQSDHPWLAGRVVGEACFSLRRNCPNGETEQLTAGAGAPCTYAPDNCAHGTHVAHTAAGKYGVARGAKILAVQVFSRASAEECEEAGYTDVEVCALSWDSDQLRALEHVYNLRGAHDIAAVNISIGGGKYPGHCDVQSASSFASWARTLAAVGIATVVSSGNDGHSDALGSPACNSTVVSVGATTIANGADAVWERSNSASTLDLLAPGVHICSAVPASTANAEAGECWQGTSMAAPHVAGAFAVLRQLKPDVTATTVETEQNMLSASGAQVTDARNGLVRGRIHVWDALVALYNS